MLRINEPLYFYFSVHKHAEYSAKVTVSAIIKFLNISAGQEYEIIPFMFWALLCYGWKFASSVLIAFVNNLFNSNTHFTQKYQQLACAPLISINLPLVCATTPTCAPH